MEHIEHIHFSGKYIQGEDTLKELPKILNTLEGEPFLIAIPRFKKH
ncbi:hypothetical protein [endosymbiont 'TC1' of Trimyema compressum]|nr:hypothetical protein [endosymbiont 'TC1' of Trimyema compressum]